MDVAEDRLAALEPADGSEALHQRFREGLRAVGAVPGEESAG